MLAKMPSSKTDTWRAILLKKLHGASVHPKIKIKNTLTFIEKIKPLTHKKTRKEGKKKNKP